MNDIACVRVADFDRTRFRVDMEEPTLRSVEPKAALGRTLEPGDLLLEKSGGGDKQPVGAVVHYDHETPAVCSNFVARMPVVAGLDPRFLTYLHAALYAARINVRSLKQSTGIQNLDAGSYLNERVALPDGSEQQAIASFLDRETAKIDGLVAKKEQLIELLQEKRAALITRAVTEGLDPNVPMKDSGVEWLGKIPAHWRVKKLKSVSKVQTGITLGKAYESRETVRRPYLRVANVQDGYLDLEDIAEIGIPLEEARRYELRSGDVLMTEGGDFDKLGRGYVWAGQVTECLHQNHIFAVRPKQGDVRPRFLSALMSSGYGRAYFTATSKQSTNLASTNSTKLGNFPLPLPETEEQEAILRCLSEEMEALDRMTELAERGIDRLREFRTALISAAVTGKIDVREETA